MVHDKVITYRFSQQSNDSVTGASVVLDPALIESRVTRHDWRNFHHISPHQEPITSLQQIPVLGPTHPVVRHTHKVTLQEGWRTDSDGNIRRPQWTVRSLWQSNNSLQYVVNSRFCATAKILVVAQTTSLAATGASGSSKHILWDSTWNSWCSYRTERFTKGQMDNV